MPRKKPTGNRNLDRADRYLISLRLTYLELQEFNRRKTAWANANGVPPAKAKMPFLRSLLSEVIEWKERRWETTEAPGAAVADPVN
jgi:hypothetical protein